MTTQFEKAAGIGLCILAAGMLGAACLAPGVFGSAKAAWAGASVAGGLALLAISVLGGATRFGLAALALSLGTTGMLWLFQPLFFPALRTGNFDRADMAAIAALVTQAGLVLALGLDPSRGIVRSVRRIGLLRLAAILALLGAFSTSVMQFIPGGYWTSFAMHLVAGTGFATLFVANVLVLMTAAPPVLPARAASPPVLAVVAGLAAAALAVFAFQEIPHVEDEVVYLFQAKTFAAGALTAPAPDPALREGLDYYLMTIRDGRWLAATLPGWSALLTLGELAGRPWLLNPLLCAISVLLAWSIAQRIANRQVATVSTLLLAASPWFLATGASLMPHLAALTATLAAWRLLLARSGLWRALFAGLLMGYVFLSRQLEATIVGTLTGLAILYVQGWRAGLGRAVSYGVGCLAVSSLFFLYNWHFTGDPFLSPLTDYLNTLWHPGANAYGFGPEIGPVERWGALDFKSGHDLTEGLVNTAHNFFYVNFEAFGWQGGSLMGLALMLTLVRPKRAEALALILIAIIAVAHVGYWFSGSFYIGPRYWFAVLVPLCFLSAHGLIALAERLEAERALVPTLLVMATISLVSFTGWRGVEKYLGYGNYSAEAREALDAGEFGDSLVFYQGTHDPGSALFLNDPFLRDGYPIFLDARQTGTPDTLPLAFGLRQIETWPAHIDAQ